MAKTPRVGETKTRLIPPLSPAEAAALSTCFIQDAAENIAVAGRQTPIDGCIAYWPPGSAAELPPLPEGTKLLPSRRAGLGASLPDAVADLLVAGYRGVCLINSDSPTLPADILVDAVRAICAPGDRVVLGPAEDGGYYLIGLKKTHPRLFEDIAWSTPFVFAQTVERAREIGLATIVLPRWYDVDDLASLRRLNTELREAADGQARHTAAFLHRRFADSGEWLPAVDPTGTAVSRTP
jgi:uncharacterized protein